MPPAAPPDPENRSLFRLAGWIRLARWVLAWERIWPEAVPILGLIGIFAALALFDVLPWLPGWLHALILAAFALGLAGLAWRAVRRLRWPSVDEAARRLERDSGLSHRPLAALTDRPAGNGRADPAGDALWRAHRRRMARLLDGLTLAPPSPGMPARDPLGLRAGVILLLVVALAAGGGDAPRRVARALSPVSVLPGAPPSVDVWITPPAYTGLAPISLHADAAATAQPIRVPAGSKVLAALAGGWGGASLHLDGRTIAFRREANGTQRVEAIVRAGQRLSVTQMFHTIAGWPIQVVADAPPSVALSGLPVGDARGRLRVTVSGADDYGLDRVWLEIRRQGAAGGTRVLTVDVPLPATHPRLVESDSWYDLAADLWAGLPVTIRPLARDTAGQLGAGDALGLTLPQREFQNPVAKAIVDARRRITDDPAKAPEAATLLAMVAANPDLFGHDLASFLALEVASAELEQPSFDLADVQALMWRVALKIEDGAVPAARRAFDEARAALERALDSGASATEIQSLLTRLRQAARALMESLASQGSAPGQSGQEDVQAVSEDDIEKLLAGMSGLADAGARDALRRALAGLSGIMDGLQAGMPAAGQGAADPDLRAVRDLTQRQQGLLDQSFRASRPGAVPGAGIGPDNTPWMPPGWRQPMAREPVAGRPDGRPAAQAQSALRDQLDRLLARMRQAPGQKTPDGLRRAQEDMGRARDALRQREWDEAIEAQGRAVQDLRGAEGEMARQGTPASLFGHDPLGRLRGGRGLGDDGTTRIPDHADIQETREILEELRRRAGDWRRPEAERAYLNRLLKQF